MTIGTKTSDLRIWHPSEGLSAYLTGLYSTKTWSGADYPVTPAMYGTKIVFLNGLPVRKVVRLRSPKRARMVDHPYSCSWQSFSNPRIALRWNLQGSFKFGGFRETFSEGNFPRRWGPLDDLALLGKLRTKMGGSVWNLGISLAELPKTLSFIAGSAIRLNTAMGAAKRGQFSQAVNILTGGKQGRNPWFSGRNVVKRSAQGWTAVTYAVQPLLLDVKNAAEYLAQQLNFPLQTTYRVTRRINAGPTVGSDPAIKYLRNQCTLQKTIIARVKEVDVPQFVGLKDPAAVAWELIPYSFMADWFIPISSWLSARGLSQAVEGTFVSSLTERIDQKGAVAQAPNLELFWAEAWSYHSGIFTRTVTSHLEVPKLEFKPLAKIPSWRRAANAIALLINAHGSKLPPS